MFKMKCSFRLKIVRQLTFSLLFTTFAVMPIFLCGGTGGLYSGLLFTIEVDDGGTECGGGGGGGALSFILNKRKKNNACLKRR